MYRKNENIFMSLRGSAIDSVEYALPSLGDDSILSLNNLAEGNLETQSQTKNNIFVNKKLMNINENNRHATSS